MVKRHGLRRVIKHAVLAVSVLALTVSGATTPAHAADDGLTESIVLSPTSRNYKIDASGSVSDSLTIINDGQKDYDFLLYARPYSVNNEAYEPNFNATPVNADLYGWVKFTQTKYRLKAGASQKVDYTINVPGGARPGGHYGVIFAETQPAQQSNGSTSVVRKKRVGAIIYATVNGTYKNEGSAIGSEIKFWQQQPPLTTSVKAKNTGNTDFADTTQITVKDVFGNVKYDVKKDYQVLPQTSREMTLNWTGSSWFGLYNVKTSQTILGKTSNNSGYVLMMPRYLPVLLLVVLLAGGVYAWFRKRKQ